MRVTLTDRRIAALRPQPGKRLELRDTQVPGLLVRVATSKRTYMLRSRFPGNPRNSVRREIAEVGTITLDEARATARDWLALIRDGRDPRDVKRQAVAAAQASEASLFGAVAEAYITRKVCQMRTRAAVERTVRNVLIPAWQHRPLADISRREVVALVDGILERGKPARAHAVLALIRALFAWAIDSGLYDLERSPCEQIRRLTRKPDPRSRVLSNDEIRAYWAATEQLGYPFGPLFQFLLLTAARKMEAAGARWREFDLERQIWTVPLERFKSKSPHLVPLTPEVLALLETLPRFHSGDHLFSCTTYGREPVTVLHAAKARLDELMLAQLRRDDPAAQLPPWRTHDLRHVVRTRLAELKVNDTVAEMLMGHAKRDPMQRVYDQSQRLDDIRLAAEAWQSELRRIISKAPTGGKVVRLRG